MPPSSFVSALGTGRALLDARSSLGAHQPETGRPRRLRSVRGRARTSGIFPLSDKRPCCGPGRSVTAEAGRPFRIIHRRASGPPTTVLLRPKTLRAEKPRSGAAVELVTGVSYGTL